MSIDSAVTDLSSITDAVKRLAITESRLSLTPSDIADDEPLNGPLLQVTSFGFLGMLMRLEDELDVTLPDDLFVGRSFTTISDLVDVVASAVTEGALG